MKCIYIAFVLAICFGLNSCNDFLDVDPDDRTTIDNVDKGTRMLIGGYQNDRGYRFACWSTDDATLANGVSDNDDIVEDLYTWTKNIRKQEHQDAPAEFWRVAYESIAQANHAIEGLEQLTIRPDQLAQVDATRGEALILRSYYHFMLVNLFGKHYDPQTASSDLGVPYQTETEHQLVVKHKRLSVEDVYDLCESDLSEGISLIESNNIISSNNKYRFTPATIYLYASRFYTFRNKNSTDIQSALNYADRAITEFGGLSAMRAWNEYFEDQEGFIDISRSNVGMIQSSYTWLPYEWMYSLTNAIVETEFGNPFGKEDYRLALYYIRNGDIFAPAFYYAFGDNGEATASDIFPMVEALLCAAEANARLGDFAEFKKYMIPVGKASYNGYNADALTLERLKEFAKNRPICDQDPNKNAMIHYVLFERRLMMLFSGMRWFDIKRYKLPVIHKVNESESLVLWNENPEGTYQLPEMAIEAGLKAN